MWRILEIHEIILCPNLLRDVAINARRAAISFYSRVLLAGA